MQGALSARDQSGPEVGAGQQEPEGLVHEVVELRAPLWMTALHLPRISTASLTDPTSTSLTCAMDPPEQWEPREAPSSTETPTSPVDPRGAQVSTSPL